MGERRRKAVETVVGGALGFAVAVGLMGLGMKAVEAIGADPIAFVVVLATVGAGFAYGCVQAGIAAVEAVGLYARPAVRAAGRWEELVPLLRRLLEWDELFPGFDHPRTVARRQALIFVLARLGRFEEAGFIAERNVGSLSRRLGATHPDTAEARGVARLLREAVLDPSLAEVVREAYGPGLESRSRRAVASPSAATALPASVNQRSGVSVARRSALSPASRFS